MHYNQRVFVEYLSCGWPCGGCWKQDRLSCSQSIACSPVILHFSTWQRCPQGIHVPTGYVQVSGPKSLALAPRRTKHRALVRNSEASRHLQSKPSSGDQNVSICHAAFQGGYTHNFPISAAPELFRNLFRVLPSFECGWPF